MGAVGPGLDGKAHHPSAGPPELGAVGTGVDFELLHGIDLREGRRLIVVRAGIAAPSMSNSLVLPRPPSMRKLFAVDWLAMLIPAFSPW